MYLPDLRHHLPMLYLALADHLRFVEGTQANRSAAPAQSRPAAPPRRAGRY